VIVVMAKLDQMKAYATIVHVFPKQKGGKEKILYWLIPD
jgi:hypothetical protein